MDNDRDLSYYHEYKGLFDDETWLSESKGIINDIEGKSANRRNLPDIYVEERLWDKLFCWLKDRQELRDLKAYAHHLPDKYDAPILEAYLVALDKIAVHTGKKAHYRNIVEWMKHIRSLPGSKDKIKEKAEQYRIKYKRRTNFIPELNGIEG